MKNFGQSLLTLWNQLGFNQRVSLCIAALAVAGGFTALVLWSRQPDLQLLYGKLSEKDSSAIIGQLETQSVQHKVGPGGHSVYVPSDQVYRLRMELAGKGLPTGDGVGFEIFDKGQFGLSDFVQRTNYLRAIQGELSRTITQLEGVRSARVMIVQPENRLLLTEQSIKPTASVFVELSVSRLETEQVNAIRNLVANAVQGLLPDQVAVVDNRGHVLSEELHQDPLLATASSQMRYRQQVEDYFAKKVESMLAPVVGAGNAVVRVSAEIETEATTSTEERFDPESQVARSETNTEDISSTTESRQGGSVGVSANVPDKAGTAAETGAKPTSNTEQNHKNKSKTYEINKVTTNVVRNPGTVRHLTAAVFVAARLPAAGAAADSAPKRTDEEIAALKQIVVNALGLKIPAGESLESIVTLRETAFQVEPPSKQIEAIQKETRISNWIETASSYVSIGVALLVFFIFWRILKKQRIDPVPVELIEIASTRPSAPIQGKVTPELVNELIRQKPANVGAALRDWVAVKKAV